MLPCISQGHRLVWVGRASKPPQPCMAGTAPALLAAAAPASASRDGETQSRGESARECPRAVPGDPAGAGHSRAQHNPSPECSLHPQNSTRASGAAVQTSHASLGALGRSWGTIPSPGPVLLRGHPSISPPVPWFSH